MILRFLNGIILQVSLLDRTCVFHRFVNSSVVCKLCEICFVLVTFYIKLVLLILFGKIKFLHINRKVMFLLIGCWATQLEARFLPGSHHRWAVHKEGHHWHSGSHKPGQVQSAEVFPPQEKSQSAGRRFMWSLFVFVDILLNYLFDFAISCLTSLCDVHKLCGFIIHLLCLLTIFGDVVLTATLLLQQRHGGEYLFTFNIIMLDVTCYLHSIYARCEWLIIYIQYMVDVTYYLHSVYGRSDLLFTFNMW